MKNIPIAFAAAALLAAFSAHSQGVLENPPNLGIESGVGAITGWHCTSRDIELRIDGSSIGKAGSGTPRADTAPVCGRSDTGYSLLYNFALLRGGTHRIDAYADGQLFASATFQAGYAGAEFMAGLAAAHDVPDFPYAGRKARVVWNSSKQNFVLTEVRAISDGPIPGRYELRHLSITTSSGMGMSSMEPGVSVYGTVVFDERGTYTITMTLTVDHTPSTQSGGGTWSDAGAYLILDGQRLPLIERGETLTFQMMAAPGSTEPGSAVLSMSRVGGTGAGPGPTLAAGGGMGLQDMVFGQGMPSP